MPLIISLRFDIYKLTTTYNVTLPRKSDDKTLQERCMFLKHHLNGYLQGSVCSMYGHLVIIIFLCRLS